MTAPPNFPVGAKGAFWHLWCFDHGNFFHESKGGRCSACGYQTNDMSDRCGKLKIWEDSRSWGFCDSPQGHDGHCAVNIGNVTPMHPLSHRFYAIMRELETLHAKKQIDYGRSTDPFANVRGSADFGVKPWVGAMVRANDKVRRIQKAAQGGTMANESVEDSFRDLAVYAVIALVLWEEEQHEDK